VVVVEVLTLAPQHWQGIVTAYGVVQSAEQIDVSLDFTGVVKKVLVDEGDAVDRGQLLLELDTDKQQLRVVQAVEAVQRARAAMEEARLNLERRQQLAERKTVSKEALDNAGLGLSRAAAAYREALAARQLAERVLADSHVESPVNGVVELKSVESGETVMAGAVLLKLQAVDSLEVQVWISESDIAYIHKGDRASVSLSGLPGQQLAASVESVGVNADQATGNFPVKLIIEQNTLLVRPGMTATVEILGIAFPEVLLLPEQALLDRDRRKVVFVLREGRAVQIEPLLGAGFSDRLLILSGLNAGDQLIVSNLPQIVDGKLVSVMAERASP
jgi:membrane fusion protein (multidrug efflux system)